jgi:hypothetical protein
METAGTDSIRNLIEHSLNERNLLVEDQYLSRNVQGMVPIYFKENISVHVHVNVQGLGQMYFKENINTCINTDYLFISNGMVHSSTGLTTVTWPLLKQVHRV